MPNLPEANAVLSKCTLPNKDSELTFPRIIQLRFRMVADRRMTAVSLAAQLYRADHHRQWPTKLNELVPKYLPAVPQDPFRKDGGAIGYQIIPHGWIDGDNRPVLFVDSGVDYGPEPDPQYAWYSHGKIPIRNYRDLSRPNGAQ